MGRGWILHVDLDQYVAAVEIRRRPELRGRPVIVGGDGDPTRPRQVVATASYEARAYGVHSGMPLVLAGRKCPDGVFLPSDPSAYDAASVEVMDVLRSFPVVVEVWGWDEAFVGAVSDDPVALARSLREAVLDRTQLSCSVGIGDNKLQAKTATGFAKPAGIGMLTSDGWRDVMGPRPVRDLWGIGPRMERNLAELGVTTVAELAGTDEATLAERFGPTMGPWYLRLGQGRGDTTVSAKPWVAKSRSREETYREDLRGEDDVRRALHTLTGQLTAELDADGFRPVARVSVKVRTSGFVTATRIRKLPEPTTSPEAVDAAAQEVLGRFAEVLSGRRAVRLLGVRVEFADL